MILQVLGGVVAVGVVGFFVWERHDMARTMIEAELRSHKATDIEISGDWFDADRDTLTYDVVYTDAHGKRVENRCKVGIRPLADQSVYWSQPLMDK